MADRREGPERAPVVRKAVPVRRAFPETKLEVKEGTGSSRSAHSYSSRRPESRRVFRPYRPQRSGSNGSPGRHGRGFITVVLADLQLAAEFFRGGFDERRKQTAGTAPGSPEINENGKRGGSLHDFGVEVLISNVGKSHSRTHRKINRACSVSRRICEFGMCCWRIGLETADSWKSKMLIPIFWLIVSLWRKKRKAQSQSGFSGEFVYNASSAGPLA